MCESPGKDSSTVTPPFDHPLQISAGLRRLSNAPFRFFLFLLERSLVEVLAARVRDWDKEKRKCDEAAYEHDEFPALICDEAALLRDRLEWVTDSNA